MIPSPLPERIHGLGTLVLQHALWLSIVALGGSWPLLASSKIKESGPTASRSRAWVLASCLSLAFVYADSLDLRTLSIFGEAVTAVH